MKAVIEVYPYLTHQELLDKDLGFLPVDTGVWYVETEVELPDGIMPDEFRIGHDFEVKVWHTKYDLSSRKMTFMCADRWTGSHDDSESVDLARRLIDFVVASNHVWVFRPGSSSLDSLDDIVEKVCREGRATMKNVVDP